MDAAEIDVLVEDDEFLVEAGSNIWLMDSHRWAFYVWEKFRLVSKAPQFSLVHADYHWDGGNDFHSSVEKERDLLAANLDQIFELVREGNWIRFDSFIAPAVIRGFIGEVHFFCTQNDGWDVGVDEELLARTGIRQVLHENIQSLSKQRFSFPVIFDLCLDLFNNSTNWYAGDIWPESRILEFLKAMEQCIREAHLVTISLSFGYSGTETDTRRLAKLVLPILQEWRR